MQRIMLRRPRPTPPGPRRKLVATPEKIESALVLVITGDRGLSGAYNSRLAARRAERLVAPSSKSEGTASAALRVGKKAAAFFRFRGTRPRGRELRRLRRIARPSPTRVVLPHLAAPFVSGEAQQVLLVSTRFLRRDRRVSKSSSSCRCPARSFPRTTRPRSFKGYTEFEPEVEKLLENFLMPRGARE
jgi:F-type H+-transporting ATPase subunit gamma